VLYSLFTGEFEDLMTQYMYLQLLPSPTLARALFTQRAPSQERLICKMNYSSVRQALTGTTLFSANPEKNY